MVWHVDVCDLTLEALGSIESQRVLEALALWGKLSVGELSDRASVDEASATRVLKKLAAVGLVEEDKEGKYRLAGNKRATMLKSFYIETTIQHMESGIAKLLSRVEELGDKFPEEVDKLIKRYYPVLKENFYWSMVTLIELAEKYKAQHSWYSPRLKPENSCF
ncbi:MAG: MarR family transcriptional regulator [Candidatus Freyarchaeota archaeon]|nr:MarR family transcriptional regulator [Candidatus Jordarchaeia archaeon]